MTRLNGNLNLSIGFDQNIKTGIEEVLGEVNHCIMALPGGIRKHTQTLKDFFAA